MLIDDCSHNVLDWNLGTVYLYVLYGVEIRRIGKTVVFVPKAWWLALEGWNQYTKYSVVAQL